MAEPPAALENMNRTWNSFDQAAEYSCIAPLTMDGVNDTQSLGCGLQGWPLTPLLPCDSELHSRWAARLATDAAAL